MIVEVRAIFASFAKRGQMSVMRSERQCSSSESESNSSGLESGSESDTYDKKTTPGCSSDCSSRASSKFSGTEMPNTRMTASEADEYNTSGKVKDKRTMRDLRTGIHELKVAMAELASAQAAATPHLRRRSSF